MVSPSKQRSTKRPAKPLKLKRFLSGDEAAHLLSALINEDISAQDIAEYAATGVVLAYLKYVSRNPGDGKCFYFIASDYAQEHPNTDWMLADGEECLQVIPYPLLGPGNVAVKPGHLWRIFVSDVKGKLVPVSEGRFEKVYAPSELVKAAQLMNDSNACPDWPAFQHAHSAIAKYEYDDYEPFEFVSPFDPELHSLISSVEATKSTIMTEGDDLDTRERHSAGFLIYLLARMGPIDLSKSETAAGELGIAAELLGVDRPSAGLINKLYEMSVNGLAQRKRIAKS